MGWNIYHRLIAVVVLFLQPSVHSRSESARFFSSITDPYEKLYGHFQEYERLMLRDEVAEMFWFGYNNYIMHAFPMDELDPIHCCGRGPDYDDPYDNRLHAWAMSESVAERGEGRRMFEVTIRIIGGLLSAHLIITDKKQRLGDFRIPDYNDELLLLAHDVASRLLPAFEGTATGIPYPRVNLLYGVPHNSINETCTAGAGTLLLEFGVLSRLLGDPTYESLARRTNKALWRHRDPDTGLLGYTIDVQTGEWTGLLSGLGAGLDSYFEYLFKGYILFGNREDFQMFNESYSLIKEFMRRGRAHCNDGNGDPPIYVNVHMRDGSLANTWVDALQAAFAGVQILNGDLEEAICIHSLYYSIWKKYGAIPERFNWKLKAPDVRFYPLRPEFAETTYLLYQSTKNPFYLHVGRDIVESLNRFAKVECGYATVHDVHDMSLEDRMESFFLSETCKYLYLLFDFENPVNRHFSEFIFSTEGHLFPIDERFRSFSVDGTEYGWPATSSSKESDSDEANSKLVEPPKLSTSPRCHSQSNAVITVAPGAKNATILSEKCIAFPAGRRYRLPLESHYMRQVEFAVGLYDDTP